MSTGMVVVKSFLPCHTLSGNRESATACVRPIGVYSCHRGNDSVCRHWTSRHKFQAGLKHTLEYTARPGQIYRNRNSCKVQWSEDRG